jgi:hypothetical protein
MEIPASSKTAGATIVAILAIAQSMLGVIRALQWFSVGTDLMGRGLLLLPMIGVLALFRGLLVVVIALFYVLIACGILLGRPWGCWLGTVVAGVNLLLVISVVAQGKPVGHALVWAVVPLIILLYLYSTTGRQAPSDNRFDLVRRP